MIILCAKENKTESSLTILNTGICFTLIFVIFFKSNPIELVIIIYPTTTSATKVAIIYTLQKKDEKKKKRNGRTTMRTTTMTMTTSPLGTNQERIDQR